MQVTSPPLVIETTEKELFLIKWLSNRNDHHSNEFYVFYVPLSNLVPRVLIAKLCLLHFTPGGDDVTHGWCCQRFSPKWDKCQDTFIAIFIFSSQKKINKW
ncbi:hypothetical protein CDAR_45901 [Caerostris darwini]|uniref:Uncharacterized protein n=1 Tax=Caerostris darwini TaxID=1538125 RepID=A0AAV4M6D0_9ARAC|nr:hypothetical protein CDAR_45901 [Caerostris darwini]